MKNDKVKTKIILNPSYPDKGKKGDKGEPGALINIPTPLISLGNSSQLGQQIFAHYLPIPNGGDNFLNHNPRYYLFMAKSKFSHYTGVKNGRQYKLSPAGFYHPTHQNGINFPTGGFFNGVTQIPLNSEFDMEVLPYKKTIINFNPFNWVRYKDGTWIVPDASYFGTDINLWKIQGKKWFNGKKKPRTAMFYLCIGIDNPDTTSKYPVLFGQPSNMFRLGFKVDFIFDSLTRNVIGFDVVIQFGTNKKNN